MKKLIFHGAYLVRLTLILPAMLLAFFALSLQSAQASQGSEAIFGTVYADSNASNTIDSGDTVVPGLTVSLFDSLGNLVDFTTTDATGSYSFQVNLPDLTGYIVVIQDLTGTGYTLVGSMPGSGTVGTPLQSALQLFPAGHNNAIQIPITPTDILGGGFSTTNDFLIVQSSGGHTSGGGGTVTGELFCDDNGNGTLDSSDDGLNGVTVQLKDASGNITTTTTDANGIYTFPNVPAGNYTILVPGVGDGLQANSTSATVTVTDNSTVTKNFPYHGGVISGYVYWDKDCDGHRDCNETAGVSNVTVTLKDCNGNVLAMTTTDCNGYYCFHDCLAAGNYQVCVKKCLSVHPKTDNNCYGGRRHKHNTSHQDVCDRSGDKDDSEEYNCRVDTDSCLSVRLSAGQKSRCNDFGFRKSCNISGCLRTEHDCNDRTISHCKVTLKDGYGRTVCSADTDDNGHYCFKDCDQGDYTVCVSKCLKTHCESNHETCDEQHNSSSGCNRTYSNVCSKDVTVYCGDKYKGGDFKYKKCN